MCKHVLKTQVEALEVRDLQVHFHGHLRFVYGNADFDDIAGVHFRCRVFDERVRELWYLVKSPNVRDGRGWARKRPHGAEHEGLELDKAAISTPTPIAPSPHFIHVQE